MSSKKAKTKVEVQSETKNEAVKAKVSGITVETALKSVSAAQAAIGRTLADVGEQVQKELQTLEDVRKTKELVTQELEELHGKDALLKNTEELQVAFEAKKLELDESFKIFQRDLADKQDAAGRQLASEEEENRFNATKAKLAADALLETDIHAARVSERDRKEALEKTWALREENIKKNETEFADLKNQVNGFPALLKAETEKAASIAGNSMKGQYEHTLALTRKDAEAAKQIAEMQIKTLNEQVFRLSAQLTESYTKLDAANTKVAEIANKALESASGQRTLAEIQSFSSKESSNGSTPRKA